MTKKIELKVVCPECQHLQKYHSHNKKVKGSRRKTCQKCGRSFKAKDQRLSNIPKKKKDLQEELQKKGKGFFKYSNSS